MSSRGLMSCSNLALALAGHEDAAVDLIVQHQEKLPVQRHSGISRYRCGLTAGLLHAGHVSTSLSCAICSIVICI